MQLRVWFVVVGERVEEAGLGRDLEHQVGQVGGRHQRVDARPERGKRGGLRERVEPLDGQLPARREVVDRVLRSETVARALVGVVDLAGELLDERVGLSGSDSARQVSSREASHAASLSRLERASANRSLGVTYTSRRRNASRSSSSAHIVYAARSTRPLSGSTSACHGRGTNRVGSTSGVSLRRPSLSLQRGERFEDRLASVGRVELDRVKQQRQVPPHSRVAAGHELSGSIIGRAG